MRNTHRTPLLVPIGSLLGEPLVPESDDSSSSDLESDLVSAGAVERGEVDAVVDTSESRGSILERDSGRLEDGSRVGRRESAVSRVDVIELGERRKDVGRRSEGRKEGGASSGCGLLLLLLLVGAEDQGGLGGRRRGLGLGSGGHGG